MKKSSLFIAAGIVILVISSIVFPISCSSLDETGLHIVRPLAKSPKLEDIQVKSATEIACVFSMKVKILSIYAQSEENPDVKVECDAVCDENGTVTITLSRATEIGKVYKMYGIVENEGNSSLTFEFDFIGMNDHRANLVLSEIRDGYTSKKMECEFIELYAVTAGNIAGLELYSAYDGEAKSYYFPPAEVKAGEYITVHLRKMDENSVDEVGDNLHQNEKINDTSNTACDLFAKDAVAHLGGEQDVILLRDSETKTIYDAICYAKKSKVVGGTWKKESCALAAQEATDAGVWQGESIEDAFDADGLTQTHSLARQNIKNLSGEEFPYTNGAKYWIVTENRKAVTPGKPNSSAAIKR